MSRSWQYIGFNRSANIILAETVKIGIKVVVELDLEGHPLHTYTQDRVKPSYTTLVYDKRAPWYDEGHELYVYTFSDGRVLEDYVQAEPWSSGPCTFMALRDAKTKEPIAETLWSEKDINAA